MIEAVNRCGFISMEDMCMQFFLFCFVFVGIENSLEGATPNSNHYLGVVGSR